MPEQDDVIVTSISITVSAKRTIQVGDSNFRAMDTSISMTLAKENKGAFTQHEAVLSALKATPRIIKKLYFDLAVAQVMPASDLKLEIDRVNRAYTQLIGEEEKKHDPRPDSSDVLGAGVAVSESGAGPSEGPVLPGGEDRGVPAEAGPDK